MNSKLFGSRMPDMIALRNADCDEDAGPVGGTGGEAAVGHAVVRQHDGIRIRMHRAAASRIKAVHVAAEANSVMTLLQEPRRWGSASSLYFSRLM